MSSRKISSCLKSGVPSTHLLAEIQKRVLDLFWFIRPRTEQEADELEKVLVVH